MPRLFFGNFDCDEQLADERQIRPELRRRINAELAACWLAVAQEGDWIWCPDAIEHAFWRRLQESGCPAVHPVSDAAQVPPVLELTPWGWTGEAREFGESVRAAVDAPQQSVVRAANSRRLSFECEVEWGVGLKGAACIESVDQLAAAVSQFADAARWVLKSEFSGAARERLLGRGPVLDASTTNWGEHRMQRGLALFLEPWLDRIAEAGVQWTIPRSGPPVLEGVTPLLTDAAGRYRGSEFGIDDAEAALWSVAVDSGRRMAVRLQQMGYFGPLGIDAMCYRDAEGNVRLRPLQDVNARWTMGRLSLGWRRFMPRGAWRHGPRVCMPATSPDGSEVRVTSPATVGSRLSHHASWLEPRM
jgi:hypothetical protein